MLQPFMFPAPSTVHIKHFKSFNVIRNSTWQIIMDSVPGKQKPHTIHHTINPLIALMSFTKNLFVWRNFFKVSAK